MYFITAVYKLFHVLLRKGATLSTALEPWSSMLSPTPVIYIATLLPINSPETAQLYNHIAY